MSSESPEGKGVKRSMSDVEEDEEEFACDLCEEMFDRDSMGYDQYCQDCLDHRVWKLSRGDMAVKYYAAKVKTKDQWRFVRNMMRARAIVRYWRSFQRVVA